MYFFSNPAVSAENHLVGVPGIEPGLQAPEARVLPLDYTPKQKSILPNISFLFPFPLLPQLDLFFVGLFPADPINYFLTTILWLFE